MEIKINMDIKQAIEFDDNIRAKIGRLFVSGFYDIALKYFSKDKTKLAKVFSQMFILEYFYIAVIDNEIAGMIACINKNNFCLNNSKKILVKNLGIIKGLFTYFAFKDHTQKYKIEIDEKTSIIDFLVTDKKYQRMGVASALINHLFQLPEYEHYILEVADTNVNALELYKKSGFSEMHRKKHFPNSGINYFLYMRYSKEKM
jgi:ribosomal protein S18 acetylase RimI-like enzyme